MKENPQRIEELDPALVYVSPLDGFNRVFKVQKEGELYALKFAPEPWKRDQYETEARVLQQVRSHPNIMQLADIYRAAQGRYLAHLLHFEEGDSAEGDLENEQEQIAPLELQEQLYNAVTYLHQNRITHGDIRSRHFIISPNKRKVTLIDFDRARTEFIPPDITFAQSQLKDLEALARFCPNINVEVKSRFVKRLKQR